MKGGGRPGARSGFSLLELILALLLFEIGLLGVAGMMLVGQRTLTRAQLTMRGTLEAKRVGDSLLDAEALGEGESTRSWGGLYWMAPEDGGLRIVATGADRADTLAYLRLWPLPGEGTVPDSAPSVGGGGV
jgi:type II secretory pathway pseudopilin PulG